MAGPSKVDVEKVRRIERSPASTPNEKALARMLLRLFDVAAWPGKKKGD